MQVTLLNELYCFFGVLCSSSAGVECVGFYCVTAVGQMLVPIINLLLRRLMCCIVIVVLLRRLMCCVPCCFMFVDGFIS